MNIEKATLTDGRVVDFVRVDDPPAGIMKKTYFAPDRSYVVQFYHDQSTAKDPQRRARLERILGKYNPTVDKNGAYWRKLFCWPTGVVEKPQFGIMCPAYPDNFIFKTGPCKGKEKEGSWFVLPKPRRMLPEGERGVWYNYFQVCILIARAVRRLHQAGLAHSDLSSRNVLVDPSSGQSTVIDIDSLVVPGIFPPDVAGTPGYIAPEVLSTLHLDLNDPKRKHPNTRTDQHALAVLMYQYLLLRHPLVGPKTHCTTSTDEDELLAMGEKALFIEDPHDRSNRPPDLGVGYEILGPYLNDLIYRAFVKGLHAPEHRPAAIEWESGLLKTWDLKYPCPNKSCPNKWFILHDRDNIKCPFCGTRVEVPIPILKLYREWKTGHWTRDSEVVVHHNLPIFKWHADTGVFPGEEADRTPQAYCALHQGKWILVNQRLSSLTLPNGTKVSPGESAELVNGEQVRLSQGEHGRIAEVQMINVSGASA